MNISSKQQARLAIFYREQKVETMKRTEVYTYSDFLAVCAGLLGLFLGMSVLSVIELIYYGSLRYYFDIRRKEAANNVVPVASIIPIDNNTND